MQEDQDSRGSNRRRAGLIAVLVAGAVWATGLAGFAVFSHAQGAGASQLAKPQDQGHARPLPSGSIRANRHDTSSRPTLSIRFTWSMRSCWP